MKNLRDGQALNVNRVNRTNTRQLQVCQTHTCDIFLEPDREIWDFSEGDWGLR